MYSVISWESPEILIEVLKTDQVMKVDGKISYMHKEVQYIGKKLSTHGIATIILLLLFYYIAR